MILDTVSAVMKVTVGGATWSIGGDLRGVARIEGVYLHYSVHAWSFSSVN